MSDLEINNLPNRLTIIRIILIPLVVIPLMISQEHLGIFAAIIFIMASITDFLDGYIARKNKLITVFGSFLDPIADKFLIVSSLIALLAIEKINAYLVMILVLREMYITSLRLVARTEGFDVPVDKFGKYKTATQMIGIPCLMIPHKFFTVIGSIFIIIAVGLSIFSCINYSSSALKKFKALRKKV